MTATQEMFATLAQKAHTAEKQHDIATLLGMAVDLRDLDYWLELLVANVRSTVTRDALGSMRTGFLRLLEAVDDALHRLGRGSVRRELWGRHPFVPRGPQPLLDAIKATRTDNEPWVTAVLQDVGTAMQPEGDYA